MTGDESDYTHFQRIKVERDGRLLALRLNRPEVLNAVDEQMQKEIAQIFYDVNPDQECDVVVLQGAGKAISAGGDNGWLGES